jgi:spoIIIJ-associated protein
MAELIDQIDRIADFLDNLLDRSGLDLDFEVGEPLPEKLIPEFENPDLVVEFDGPDVDELLANKAELLLALEHLTMEMLRMPSENHARLSFDANDYRLMRTNELRLLAQTAAENVARSGRPYYFNSMTSRERRIIHLTLNDHPGVRSESVGTGVARVVAVVPKDMVEIPEPPAPPPPRREGGGGGDRRGPGGGGRGGDRRGPGGGNRGGGDRRGPRPPR